MIANRAELAGTGAALLLHVALIVALSISLAGVDADPEPPAMEVELVEEVGLTAAAPTPAPPASQAPEIGEAEPQPAPPEMEPVPPPPASRLEPAPAPKPTPKPAPRAAQRSPAKPAAKPAPAKPAPAKPAPRVSRLGDDFLKGIAAAPATTRPAAAAPTFSASALAGIAQAIRRQVQPCADRQVDPGNGANRITVRMRLRLNRAGRLLGPPQILSTSGVDEENRAVEERVKDIAIAAFVGCAPLTGLPPELYKTRDGRGWGDFVMTYRLP